MARHTYALSAEMDECPATVWRLLTTPRLQHLWKPATSVAAADMPDALRPGASWQESRAGCLFLRPTMRIQVLDVSLQERRLTTRLDDGGNVVTCCTRVHAHPGHPARSVVEQTVECCTRAGASLLPSERLAIMWRKHDTSLARLREYLQPCGSAGASDRGVRGRHCGSALAAPAVLAT